eukprot:COSAG02_NODE_28_length_51367_cov_70.053932_35_plen_553_part_00
MASSDEDEHSSDETGGDRLGIVELSFCVFPSLRPSRTATGGEQHQQQLGGYVPWELQAPPWRRMAKFVRKKYMVGLLARGRPAVVVVQTNFAPEHPNRSKQRTKALLSWAAKELSVTGEVRLVLRARVQGVGFTMGHQVEAVQEAHATELVHAFFAETGEESATADAVIACFKAAELEPDSWVPQLEELRDSDEYHVENSGEDCQDELDSQCSPLLEFIESVKTAAAAAAVEAAAVEAAAAAGERDVGAAAQDMAAAAQATCPVECDGPTREQNGGASGSKVAGEQEVDGAPTSPAYTPTSSPIKQGLFTDVAAGHGAKDSDDQRTDERQRRLSQHEILTTLRDSADEDEGQLLELKEHEDTKDRHENKEQDEAASAAAAVAARQQLDERAMVATRVMDEGRGLGLVTREELRDLLRRCAHDPCAVQVASDRTLLEPTRAQAKPDLCPGQMLAGHNETCAQESVHGDRGEIKDVDQLGQSCSPQPLHQEPVADAADTEKSRDCDWAEWDRLLWAPKDLHRDRQMKLEPPPGMSPKQIRKWHKRQGKLAQLQQ